MSNDASSAQPEYLGDAPAGGGPGGGPDGEQPPRSRRRGLVLAAAAVGAAGAVAVGGWAAVAFLAGGDQPAQAVPADALFYVGVDLDPSAGQKIEAVSIAKKFPALDKELGLDATDDLRKWMFEEALGDCDGVSYADDVAPWIGERAAVAVLPAVKKAEGPRPVVTLQVTDEQAAADKLPALLKCGAADVGGGEGGGESGAETGGYALGEGHVVFAETTAIAEDAVAAAAAGALADDSSFQRWTSEAGDPGIITMYVAPEAAAAVADLEESFADAPAPGMGGNPFMGGMGMGMGPMGMDPEQLEELTKDFEGMAAVVRFADGAVEAEFAGGGLPQATAPAEDTVTDVRELPASTGLAMSMAFPDGWVEDYLDMMSQASGGMSTDDLLAEGEAETGLELPEDIETLLGDSLSFAVDSSLDADEVASSEDPSSVPAGIRVTGDPDEILPIVEKLKKAAGPDSEMLVVEQGDGAVAFGFDPDYVASLVEQGGLGDDATFREAVPEAEQAAGVFYVSFDAGDSWVERLVEQIASEFSGSSEEDAEIGQNMEPLEAFGVSSWIDGEVQRGLLRLSTD